jgi:hypothetical protein
MTETSEILDAPHKTHRKRRRWILAATVMVVALLGWAKWPTESAVSRVKRVRIGQTSGEVAAIMGRPRMTYVMGAVSGECYGPKTALELEVRMFLSQHLAAALSPEVEQFPVAIEYDAGKRVERIRLIPGVVD